MDFLSAGTKKSGRRRKVDINSGLTLHVYVFHFSRVRLVHWRSPLYGSRNKVHFSWLTVQKQNINCWVSLSSKHRKICCPGAKRTNGTLFIFRTSHRGLWFLPFFFAGLVAWGFSTNKRTGFLCSFSSQLSL